MWRTYYANIFNPARLKVGAMLKEMPKKYWRNMPETSLVQPLIASARARELEMIDRAAAKDGLTEALEAERRLEPGGNVREAWEALLAEARGCTRCELVQMRHPDGIRRRPARRPDHVRRRAAGRPGGSCRAPVRRPRRAIVRRSAGTGRDRPHDRLRHQRGQAFQIHRRAASAASTRSPTPARSTPAAGGSTRSAR